MAAAPAQVNPGFAALPPVAPAAIPPPPIIAPNAIISSQDVQAHELYCLRMQAKEEVPQAAKDAAWGRLIAVRNANTAQYVEATVQPAGPGLNQAQLLQALQAMPLMQALLALPQQVQGLAQQMQGLQGLPQQVQGLQQQMQGLQGLPEQVQGLAQQVQGLQGLQQQVQGLAQQMQGLAQQVQGLQGLQQQVQGLAQQMQGLPQQVQGLVQQMQGLPQQMQGPAQQVQGLQGLQQQVQGLQQQMQALQGLPLQVQALQGLPLQVQGLQQEVQALRLQIDNLEVNSSIRLRNSVVTGAQVQWLRNAQGNLPPQRRRTREQLRGILLPTVNSLLTFYGLPLGNQNLDQKRRSLLLFLGVFV